MRQGKHDHRELHWLPVRDRILHKLLSVTYRSVHENPPLYLSELIPPHTPHRFLRSASELFLAVPVPRTVKQSDMASESLDVSPQSQWNALPTSIRESDYSFFPVYLQDALFFIVAGNSPFRLSVLCVLSLIHI